MRKVRSAATMAMLLGAWLSKGRLSPPADWPGIVATRSTWHPVLLSLHTNQGPSKRWFRMLAASKGRLPGDLRGASA